MCAKNKSVKFIVQIKRQSKSPDHRHKQKQQQEIEMPAKVYKFHAMLQINIPTPTPPLTTIALAAIEKFPSSSCTTNIHTSIHTYIQRKQQ